MQKKSMHILLNLLKVNNFKYYKWSVHLNRPFFVDRLPGTCKTLFFVFVNLIYNYKKNNADYAKCSKGQ